MEDLYKACDGSCTSMATPRFTLSLFGHKTDPSHMKKLGNYIVYLSNIDKFIDDLKDYFSSGIEVKCNKGELYINNELVSLDESEKRSEAKKKYLLRILPKPFVCHLSVLRVELIEVGYGSYSNIENTITKAENCYSLKEGHYKDDNEWRVVIHLDRAKTKYHHGKTSDLEILLTYISYIPVYLGKRVIGELFKI